MQHAMILCPYIAYANELGQRDIGLYFQIEL